MRAAFRLAVVLSAMWLVGLGCFAGYVWSERAQWPQRFGVPAPLVEYTAPVRFAGEADMRFNWPQFGLFAGGGLAFAWLLSVGVAWVIAGFRAKPGNAGSVGSVPTA